MIQHASTCLKGPKSRKGKLSKKARASADVRHELVARVRREIAAGTYDTPEKMEIALERMFAHQR